MGDKRRQPSECLGVLLLLLFFVFSTFFTSVESDAFDDDDVKTENDGGRSLFPAGNIKKTHIRNKRVSVDPATALVIAPNAIAALRPTGSSIQGIVTEQTEEEETEKFNRQLFAHFEEIQKELEKQTEELQSINQEIKNLSLGLSMIYFEHEDKIKVSLWTLLEYLEHPNDHNRNVFIEKASHLGQSIRVLVDGLLGLHTFSHDITVVMRDAAKCRGRKLRKKIKSIGSLIMAGLYVRGQYKRIINATEGDSSPFKKYIDTSLLKLETRLDDMVIECQADERNVSDEMRKIMNAALTRDRKTVAGLLLEFLEEKYDTKRWIVLVQHKGWEDSVWTAGFHRASVRNDVAFAISVDRRTENFPELKNLIDIRLKTFDIPIWCSLLVCECLSSSVIEEYLNRFLIPLRTKSEVETETLVITDMRWQNLIVAISEDLTNNPEKIISHSNSSKTYSNTRCNHWVIVIPTRPAITFNPSPNSPSRLRNQIECSYDPDRAAQDYGPLRNERAQSYLSVQGDSSEEGASIILDRQWRNSPGQKWKFVDGQLRNEFGKCLTLWNTFLGSFHYLYQYNCDYHWPGQKWDVYGLQILNDRKYCLGFDGKVHQGPMFVYGVRACDLSPSFIWYNRDTDCEDAMVIPSTTNGSRPLRNEFSRLFLNVADNYGTEQPWSNRPAQLWKFVDGLLKNDNGKCLAGSGWYVWSVDCADTIGNNGRWTYTENRQIKSADGYCLSSAGKNDYVYYDRCKEEESQQRWWDVSLSVVRRASDPWKGYKTKYGKSYTETHDAHRKQLFLATDAIIAKHNSQTKATFLMEHNQFSDMTPDELKKYQGLVIPANKTRSLESLVTFDMKDQTIPTSLDYRTSKCLPPVKNQGQCGSCWAFSAITPLEFAWCKKSGALVVLSEQQLVDCDPYDNGCNGGWYTNAWHYLQYEAGGSAQQSLYPYTATTNTCKFTSSMIGARISDYRKLPVLDAASMQAALQAYGPLAVPITVVNSFYSYASGVYNDVACDDILPTNHAVVVVGYGTTTPWFSKGIDYWIVRNSWGSGWGQSGYILMQRGVNKCKIESNPAAVIV